jgi:hypothetical protein
MDEHWYMDLVNDLAAFTPDQRCDEIVKQLISIMVACTDKLDSGDIGGLLAIAAAIHRKGKDGWRVAT